MNSPRRLLLCTLLALCLGACYFTDLTSFWFQMDSRTEIGDATVDSDGRLVIARDGALWYYKDGKFFNRSEPLLSNPKARLDAPGQRNVIWTLARSSDSSWQVEDIHFNPSGAILQSATKIISNRTEPSWVVRDIAASRDGRLYFAGRRNGRAAVWSCFGGGSNTCTGGDVQYYRADTGSQLATVQRVDVDHDSGRVYIIAGDDERNYELMSYDANLNASGVRALAVPRAGDLTAHKRLVAVVSRNKDLDPPGPITIYQELNNQFSKTDSTYASGTFALAADPNSNAECGYLWGVKRLPGKNSTASLVLDKHEVCSSQGR